MFEIRLFYLLICDGVGFFYICIFKDEVGLDFLMKDLLRCRIVFICVGVVLEGVVWFIFIFVFFYSVDICGWVIDFIIVIVFIDICCIKIM